jgi:hypothetical protein
MSRRRVGTRLVHFGRAIASASVELVGGEKGFVNLVRWS